MAGTSFRNMISHIATVAFCHFIPTEHSWPQPKDLSQGAREFIRMVGKSI